MGFESWTPEKRRAAASKGGKRVRVQSPEPTVCRRGHELTGDNVVRYVKTRKPASGEPYQHVSIGCRICINERRRTLYYASKHTDRG